MHWADDGPYTGEVSALMIKECGAELVEIGHFERRQEFSETDSSVNKKVRSALHHSLTPLICIGETGLERDYSVAEEVVACQVKIALNGVSTDGVPGVIIAYEPGWAIGEKATEASPLHVNAMHRTIRQAIASQHGRRASEQVHVVYGGSVNHVVVAGQHHGCTARHEFGGVGNQALKPGQLVIEFRSGLRIPIGEVDGSEQDSLNRRFNVASLPIFSVSRRHPEEPAFFTSGPRDLPWHTAS